MKKLLVSLLCIALFVTSINIPVSAQSDDENYIVMETVKNNVKIRSQSNKKGETLLTLSKNELVYIYGSTTNSAGNTWYLTKVNDENAFVFSENLVRHEHNFKTLENSSISLCHCGQYKLNSIGINQVNSLAATAGVLAGPTALGSLTELGAASGIIIEGACFLGIAFLGGALIYLILQNNGVSLSVQPATTGEKFDKDEISEGRYYKAAVLGDDLMLVYGDIGGIEEANNFLLEKLKHGAKSGNYDNVYTMLDSDAQELCQRFQANGIGFSYGKSKNFLDGTELSSECHDKNRNLYFSHYHLFYSPYNHITSLADAHRYADGKINNCHVFYGLPGCQSFL